MAMQDRQESLDRDATHGNAYLRPRASLMSSIWISWISTNLSH
jgi:hypothetical protein